jgi:hypothetical protein
VGEGVSVWLGGQFVGDPERRWSYTASCELWQHCHSGPNLCRGHGHQDMCPGSRRAPSLGGLNSGTARSTCSLWVVHVAGNRCRRSLELNVILKETDVACLQGSVTEQISKTPILTPAPTDSDELARTNDISQSRKTLSWRTLATACESSAESS